MNFYIGKKKIVKIEILLKADLRKKKSAIFFAMKHDSSLSCVNMMYLHFDLEHCLFFILKKMNCIFYKNVLKLKKMSIVSAANVTVFVLDLKDLLLRVSIRKN